MEDIAGRDAPAAADAFSEADPPSGADAYEEEDASAGEDATSADGGDYDRTVPGRPPPQDAGSAPATTPAGNRPPEGGGAPEGAAPATTLSILRKQSTDCLDFAADAADDQVVPIGCVADNGCLDPRQQGGTCEDLEGGLNHFTGMLPTGRTCPTVLGGAVSETAICLETLDGIFSSACMQTLDQTQCLCGAADRGLCVAGNTTPLGPVYETYACDFNTPHGDAIVALFTNPIFGAGMANGIAQCAAQFGCTCCFGDISPDGGTCALPPKAP